MALNIKTRTPTPREEKETTVAHDTRGHVWTQHCSMAETDGLGVVRCEALCFGKAGEQLGADRDDAHFVVVSGTDPWVLCEDDIVIAVGGADAMLGIDTDRRVAGQDWTSGWAVRARQR